MKLVREGAADYVAKPWDDTKLLLTVQNLLSLRAARQENARFKHQADRQRQALEQRYDLCGVVYKSAAMHAVVSLATQVARADVPVLITGPNGSGKEKLAEIVHANSARKSQPLAKVNAGAIAESLLEAELFGAEAGAYTGATKSRAPYFRLNVIELRIPPLRERSEDIAPLSSYFVQLHHGQDDGRAPVLSGDALMALEAHDFPGNVRELENRVKRSLLVRSGQLIGVADLDLGGKGGEAAALPAAERAADPLAEAERQVIEQALVAARGVVSKAAAELGLSRQALYRRMERLGIELERRPKS